MRSHRDVFQLAPLLLTLVLLAFGPGCKQGPTAADYIRDAREALEDERYDEASTYIDLAEEKGMTTRDVRILRARVHRKLAERAVERGESEPAFHHYVEAGDVDPRRIQSARAYVEAVRVGEKAGMGPSKLAPVAQRAVDQNPSMAKARRLAGRMWDEKGARERALRHYLWLWQADHSRTRIGRRLATIYESLGRRGDAIVILEQVLEVEPDNAQAALNLAQLYDKMGRPEEARRLYERLVDTYPKKPGILLRYSQFLVGEGESERARELKRRAYELMPGVERRNMRELR